LKGRVGDAPFIGCGGYVNNIGGATVTGFGESIMKVTLARDVVYNMENGQNAQVRFLNLQYNATIKHSKSR
jgi:beta-aspartyl-peptidase (threonine type)